MGQKRYEDVKKEVRSVLLASKEDLTLPSFLKDYRNLLGLRFPTREFGYTTDIDFINSMPDVVLVKNDRNGSFLLKAVADETTKHIQKLVNNQKSVKKKTNSFQKYTPNTSRYNFSPASNAYSGYRPFVPALLRAEIIQILQKHPDGIGYTALLIDYYQTFSKRLNLEWLSVNPLERFRNLVKAVPELEVRTVGSIDKLCLVNFQKESKAIHQSVRMSESHPRLQNLKAVEKNAFTCSSSSNESSNEPQDISVIPNSVKYNCEKVLKSFPGGILAVHFPIIYEKMNGEPFNLHELGYTSLLELADAIPEVFFRVQAPESRNNWLIFHVNSFKNVSLATDVPQPKIVPKLSPYHLRLDTPCDIAASSLKYVESELPERARIQYIPVFVSAIYSPSIFWFQVQSEEEVSAFAKLENEMEFFYNSQLSNKYKIADADILVGTPCVTRCKDGQFYRGVISSIFADNSVLVSFVDYGSSERVSRSFIYYLRYHFMHLPTHAHKAQLAAIKPKSEKNKWSLHAQKRFLQLCNQPFVMAQIFKKFDSKVALFLCDSSGDNDIHINDVLVMEGYAEYSVEDDNNNTPQFYSNQESSDSCSSSSRPASAFGKPYASKTFCQRNKSIDSEHYSYSNEYSNGRSFSNKLGSVEQSVKNCVKRVALGDNYYIQMILLKKNVYVSSGDLCNLLWKNKGAEVLANRLKFKEVEVPTVCICRDEFQNIFEQCERYSIAEFCDNKKPNSVILYSLKCALKILNIFGHPSKVVREKLCKENQIINSGTTGWEEPLEQNGQLNECVDESSIDRLCLYDLKAVLEGLRYKRSKLLDSVKRRDSSIFKELKKVDASMNSITKRIEEIQEICSLFSVDM